VDFSFATERRDLLYFGEGLTGEAGFPFFFMKAIKQTAAVNHIKGLLQERGFNIPSRSLGDQRWIIFEHQGRQIGVDSASGVWIRGSEGHDWRCLAIPCSVSGAIQAVEFLTTEQSVQ
jgi:hypothetical protein